MDILDQEHIPYIQENETIVIFHIDKLIKEQLEISKGKHVIHILSGNARNTDADGRAHMTHHHRQPSYFESIADYIGEN